MILFKELNGFYTDQLETINQSSLLILIYFSACLFFLAPGPMLWKFRDVPTLSPPGAQNVEAPLI